MLLTACVLFLAHAVSATTTFVVPHTAGQDDTPALTAALAGYTSYSTILFQSGVTYNIFTPIKFPVLNNVEIQIEGNLTYPKDISKIQSIVASSSFPGHWITFTGGSNVTLRGSLDPNWGWIDGQGQAWWNAKTLKNRPHGISFSKISGGVIRDMKIWKPIAWNFATGGSSNLHIFNNQIYAVSTNRAKAFPSNTDGFSAGGTDLLFENNHVVNGDDCLTVGSGAKNIHFRNSYCEGGHGLSIGSLGKGGKVASVANVLIENVVMKNSVYGARFKSWSGGQGLAQNVTYKNITLDKVRLPIYITQNYWDSNTGTNPHKTSTQNTHLQDFLFQGFSGTLDDSVGPVVSGSTGKEVAIFDIYAKTVSNILVKQISVATTDYAPVTVMCNPAAISTDIGFQCLDGAFVATAVGL